MATMQGSESVWFSELFADTLKTHGFSFAYQYYVVTHKLAFWEFLFWLKVSGVSDCGLVEPIEELELCPGF